MPEAWINLLPQDADQPHIARYSVNILEQTNGFETGVDANADQWGYPVGGPNALGMKEGSGSRGLVKILDIPDTYKGRPGLSGTFRFLWRSDDPTPGQGGGVTESTMIPNINTNTTTYDTIEARGHVWQYVDFEFDPTTASEPRNLVIVRPDDNGYRFIQMAVVNHTDLPVWESGNNIPNDVIESCAYFDGIRYMRGLGANLTANDPPIPDFRFIPEEYFQHTKGQRPDGSPQFEPKSVPVSRLTELCNRAQCGLWYNIAPDASDAAMQTVAETIAATFDPSLRLLVEFGNEGWNSADGFAGYDHFLEKGQEIWPSAGNTLAIANYMVLRVNKLYRIFETALSGTGISPEWVLGGSATGNDDFGPFQQQATLASTHPDWDDSYSTKAPSEAPVGKTGMFTHYAIGMYFGGAEGGFVPWLAETFDNDIDRSIFYFKMINSGQDDPANHRGPGKNTAPTTAGGLGNTFTGAIATSSITLGEPLSNWKGRAGDDRYKQKFIWADVGTPDETDVVRINRTGPRVTLEIDWTLATDGQTGWAPVLEWADGENPPTLYDMSRSAQLVAVGDNDGVNGQLRRAYEIRITDHTAFCAEHGYTLIGYEGGNGDDGAPGAGSDDEPAYWKFESHYGPQAKEMQRLYYRFNQKADENSVPLIAWFENVSPTRWERGLPTFDTRGLVRSFPFPKPVSQLPPKALGALGYDPDVEVTNPTIPDKKIGLIGASIFQRPYADASSAPVDRINELAVDLGLPRPTNFANSGEVFTDTVTRIENNIESQVNGDGNDWVFFVHRSGNDVSARRPYSGEADKTFFEDGLKDVWDAVEALNTTSKVIPMNITFRPYTTTTEIDPDTYDDSSGSGPFNENAVNPAIAARFPEWSRGANTPFIDLYTWSRNLAPAFEDDVHFYDEAEHLPVEYALWRYGKGIGKVSPTFLSGKSFLISADMAYGSTSGLEYAPRAKYGLRDVNGKLFTQLGFECSLGEFDSQVTTETPTADATAYGRLADSRFHRAEVIDGFQWIRSDAPTQQQPSFGQLRLLGATAGATGTLKICGLVDSTASDRVGSFTHNGTTELLDAATTATSNQISLSFVADANGDIIVDVSVDAGSTFAYFSAMLVDFD